MQATANIPAKIAPTNHPIAIRRLVNFYLFYLNKAVHFNYFLIFLASFLSFSIFIWIAAATNARSFRSSPRYSCGHLYFNPRTRVGCDGLTLIVTNSQREFQSTHPHGCDYTHHHFPLRLIIISIHAPAWGATLRTSQKTCRARFQSTHPHGVRLAQARHSKGTCLFQSTHPGGVRLEMNGFKSNLIVFQSTHPGGVRRSANNVKEYWKEISIHAPGWGATDFIELPVFLRHISIHAPGWGAT